MAHLENVSKLSPHDELVADVARKLGVHVLVRGLRNARTFSMKPVFTLQSSLQERLRQSISHSRPEHVYISPSAVRELLKFGQDISTHVQMLS